MTKAQRELQGLAKDLASSYQVVSAIGTTIANRISQPNARLIAATPVLYAGCLAALVVIQQTCAILEEEGHGTWPWLEKIEMIKSAIAQATT